MRAQGYSYTSISEKIKVSKSTLSNWLGALPYSPNQEMVEKMGRARVASGLAKNRLKLESLNQAHIEAVKDIGKLSQRDIFMLGIGLYIGEGTKTHDIVRVINSNPQVIRFAIRWFKESCGLSQSNFRLRLHVYPDTNIEKSIEFWSKATAIPKGQFQVAQVDRRKDKKTVNKGKLPYGTAHLSMRSNGNKRFGRFFFRKINAWIEEVLK